MKKLLLIVVFFLSPLFLFSQSDSTYFSQAIKIDLKKYKKDTALAYRKGDLERGKFLFDSLVHTRLTGTHFDDFTMKKVNGSKVRLSKFKKPVILITFASWCVTGQGEIPAINKLAKKYGKEVKFVVLFWDRKHNMKKIAKKFNHNVTVCYAHESYRNDEQIVAALKHTLGFPTSFYLDENLKVMDIRRCGIKLFPKKTVYHRAYAMNYNSYLDGLSSVLINREVSKEMLAVK